MIASELALDLGIDAGVLSKRLKLYYGESGEEKQRILSEQTVQQMRKVDDLITSSQAKNTRTAVLMVLGKYVEAAPPNSVHRIENLLLQLLDGQAKLGLKLDQLHEECSDRIDTTIAESTLTKVSDADISEYFNPLDDTR